jgi:hypothetical protein
MKIVRRTKERTNGGSRQKNTFADVVNIGAVQA